MKKISIILILGFLLAGNLFAQEADSSGVKPESSGEIGVYVKDYFPVGKMSEHAKNFIGGGLSYVYNSPIVIPVGQNGIQLGFSGRVDYAYGFASSYVNKWNAVNILAGVLFELPLNEYVTIMPGVEYGVQLDFVDSTRKANRLYLDQSLQISPTFKFNIPSLIKNGIALEANPAWAIGFEKSSSANYLGMRIGVTYNLGTAKAENN